MRRIVLELPYTWTLKRFLFAKHPRFCTPRCESCISCTWLLHWIERTCLICSRILFTRLFFSFFFCFAKLSQQTAKYYCTLVHAKAIISIGKACGRGVVMHNLELNSCNNDQKEKWENGNSVRRFAYFALAFLKRTGSGEFLSEVGRHKLK